MIEIGGRGSGIKLYWNFVEISHGVVQLYVFFAIEFG